MTLRLRLIFLKQGSYLHLDISCSDLQWFPFPVSILRVKSLRQDSRPSKAWSYLPLSSFSRYTCMSAKLVYSLYHKVVLYFLPAVSFLPITFPLSPTVKNLFIFFSLIQIPSPPWKFLTIPFCSTHLELTIYCLIMKICFMHSSIIYLWLDYKFIWERTTTSSSLDLSPLRVKNNNAFKMFKKIFVVEKEKL